MALFELTHNSYRIITPNTGVVTGTHSDLPAYITHNDLSAGFWSDVQSDGGDIRATTPDRLTQLGVDIAYWDYAGQECVLYIEQPTFSQAAAGVAIFTRGSVGSPLSQPAASATGGSESVWPVYEAVYHFDTVPSGASTHTQPDSTGNGHTMTIHGTMTSGDSVSTGIEGKGLDFDGTDDYGVASTLGYASGDTELTIQFFAQIYSGHRNTIFNFGDSSASPSRILCHLNWTDNNLYYDFYEIASGRASFSNVSSNNNWTHYAFVSVEGGASKVYKDGSQAAINASIPSNSMTLNGLYIGKFAASGVDKWRGQMDELRVAKSELSADWIASDYDQHTTSFWQTAADVIQGATPPAFLPKIINY